MSIQYFEALRFRNFAKIDITPSPHLNIIYGNNGSGKTSLLEAIYYLGRARSFRTAKNHHLIANDCEDFICFGKIKSPEKTYHNLGIQRRRHDQNIKINGEVLQRTSDLARLLPMQVINNDVHHLIDGGPKIRRQFLDWGIFHSVPEYGLITKKYRQILNQRNAALKAHWQQTQIRHWDEGLIELGLKIDALRQEYVQKLSVELKLVFQDSFNLPPVQLHYRQGWDQACTFEEALNNGWEADYRRGLTHQGPHKAELSIRSDQRDLKDYVSRGQQKIISTLLVLAQIQLFSAVGQQQEHLVLLIDDLPSELDHQFAEYFLKKIQATQSQLFVTTTDHLLLNMTSQQNKTLFHVEHGVVTEKNTESTTSQLSTA